ncbi:helix-turn-helix domain-containing protein [Haloarcula sp. S1AR25-5A]|uniref:Helix-turn-helix domain-containing protein n=1 Tax=Haloarcula terrestris TaxID=2950533 RepID=A0AAE4F1E4_9EURY|nr:helix-turn-helix domain-containing protein [Haloarcula terrestris]MDS0223782.1 helix-turn-helix domain-containing protein [Haloarcula terrestris]
MSNRARNDSGKYTDKLTEQDVLKAFDYETTAEAPMLTASEITDAVAEHFDIEVSSETVRRRLREMEDSDLVASKKFGASAVGWTALVGPGLADDVAAEADRRLEEDEFVSLDEV